METLLNLIRLYGGVILINASISALLWAKHKTPLARLLFLVWFFSFFSLVLQGVFMANTLQIVFAWSSSFLIHISLAHFIGIISNTKVPWKTYVFLLVLAYPISAYFYFKDTSFLITCFPMAIAVTAPIFYTPLYVIKTKWKELTFSGKGLIITCLFEFVHYMDFPFLRDNVEFAVFGYIVAILIMFSLTLFAPSVVVETVTQEKARVTAEIDVAQRIQMEILPKSPEIPGYDLCAYMMPADEVGGDYYDIHSFKDFSWILLGDVTGHGLGSGLVMFMIQSIMTSILHTKQDISPSQLNCIANEILFNNLERLNEKRPTTMVSICLKKNNELLLSGCHDNIFWYHYNSDSIELIELDMFPLGLGFVDGMTQDLFQERSLTLETNDILFIGTDGITEAIQDVSGSEEVQYGEERLMTLLKETARTPLEEIKSKLLQDLALFTNNTYADDVTFLMIKALNTT